MHRAESRVVEIRVAGTVGRLVRDHLPGFVAAAQAPVTVINGRLDPGEDLAGVIAVLIRHGVHPLDGRVYSGGPRKAG